MCSRPCERLPWRDRIPNAGLCSAQGCPNAAGSGERERTQTRTLVGHGRRRDDYVRVVLVLEALTEDVHVQGPEEAKTAPLPERRRRFAGDFDAAVREA